ncbi:MAG: preprotein translocase subunit YajC [Desulfobaccales bacterium]
MIDKAYAASGIAGQDWSNIFLLLMMVSIFVIFYFLLIRPQQKKAKEHRQFLENLKRGDRVITSGGLIGEIITLGDQVLTLEIADKVRVEVGRGHIAGFAPKK